KLIQASYKKEELTERSDSALDDFNPIDLSTVDPPEAKSGTKPEPKLSSVTVALDEGGDIAVPDFHGKTVREVTQQCVRLGLNPVLIGSSLAQDQSPAPGAKVRSGAKITVRFDAVAPNKKLSASHGKNRN